MGDRYFLQLKCAWCGVDNPSKEKYEEDCMENCVYYAPTSGFMDFKCEKCGKINWIQTNFEAVKVENKEELDKLYEQNGFS